VSAQKHGPDVVLTTEGKYVEGIYVYEDENLIILGRKNKLGMKRLIPFDKNYDIFSISTATQGERVIYNQDFKIGNVFTPDEMRLNINGIMDAKERYNGKWVFIGSYLTGLSTVMLQTYDYKQNQLFTGRPPTTAQFLVPLSVTIAVDFLPQRIKPRNVDIDYYEDPYYEAGYRYQRNGKRRVNAAAGSFLGIATGIVTYFIVNK
jgi:hypothetical protein